MEKYVYDTLVEFRNKIERTGIVDKNECLSLEESLNTNVFTETKVINYVSAPGTQAGVKEVKEMLDKFLKENEVITNKEVYEYRDIIHLLDNCIIVIKNLIKTIADIDSAGKDNTLGNITNKSIALYYKDNKLENLLEECNLLLVFNNYQYINKIASLKKDPKNFIDSINIRLEAIKNLIVNEKIKTNGVDVIIFPYLSKLCNLGKFPIVAENSSNSDTLMCSFEQYMNKITTPCLEPITIKDLVELSVNTSKVISTMELYKGIFNSMKSINNLDEGLDKVCNLEESKIYKYLKTFYDMFECNSMDNYTIDNYLLDMYKYLIND